MRLSILAALSFLAVPAATVARATTISERIAMASRQFDVQRTALCSRYWGRVIAVMADGTAYDGESMSAVLSSVWAHEPDGGFLLVDMWDAPDQ